MSSTNPVKRQEVVSFLQNGFMPASTDQGSTSTGDKGDVLTWIQELTEAKELSADSLLRLRLLKDVHHVAGGSPFLIRHLLREASPQPTGLAQIAVRDYFTEASSKVSTKTLEQMQARIFEKVPTAVVLAMIVGEELLEDEEDRLKNAVSRTLYELIKEDTSIISAEFRAKIYSENFLAQSGGTPTSKKRKPVNMDEVYELVKALQRLQYLVTDPNHISHLYDEGIRSAHHVAVQSKSYFADRMKTAYDMPEPASHRIHDHATTIDCRNQETWANILSSVKNDFVASVNKGSDKPPGPQAPSYGSKAYNFTDMFDLQFNECEDCCSVVGLSAYFVDLLDFLRSSPLSLASTNTTDQSKTKAITDSLEAATKIEKGSATAPDKKPETEADNKPKTVLDALLQRRPDLEHMELSCANCKNKLPYICIVIEVLESSIASMTKNGESSAILAVNESESVTRASDGGPALELSASSIYQKELAEQMFPLQTFPYNQALDTIEACLSNLGISQKDIVALFQSDSRLLTATETSDNAKSAVRESARRAGITITKTRAQAASVLNLQPEEFRTICGVHIVDEALLSSAQQQVAGRPAAHVLWGYSSADALLDIDETRSTGLCFVKTQLLPRSGLPFEELQDILTTLYFGARLVLVDRSGSKNFSGQVSDMRLRFLNATSQDVKGPDGKLVPPVGPLTDQLCFELQSFIRLKNKLGWSIAELDAAISCLAQQRVENALSGDLGCSQGLSAEILQSLASVVQLSKIMKTRVPALLPLWNDISTHGKSSFYHQLCLNPIALQMGDDVFLADVNGKFLENGGPIRHHGPVLQIVLDVDDDGFRALKKTADLDKTTDELTVGTLSKLYRFRILSDLLKVEPEDLPRVLEAFPRSTDFFASPEVTLDLVQTWRNLIEKGWAPMEIADIVHPSVETATSSRLAAAEVAQSIAGALSDYKKSWTERIASKDVSAEDVDDMCRQLFDPAIAQSVSTFVQGLQVIDEPLPAGVDPAPLLHKDIKRISVSKPSTVSLHGMLTADEKTMLLKSLAETNDRPLASVIEMLDAKSKQPSRAIVETLFESITDQSMRTQVIKALSTDIFSAPLSKGEAVEAMKLKIARERSAMFAEIALPSMESKTVGRMLYEYAQKKYPKLNSEVYRHIWSEHVSVPVGKQVLSASELAESLSFTPPTGKEASVLFPLSVVEGDSIKFHLPAQSEPVKLLVNGVSVALSKAESGELSTEGIRLNVTAVQMGVATSIECSSGLKDIAWSTASTGKVPLSDNTVILDPETLESISSLLRSVDRPAAVLNKAALSLKEVQYMRQDNTALKLDLSRPELSSLAALGTWALVVGSSPGKKTNNSAAVIDFLQMPSAQISGPNYKPLAKQLSTVMKWPETQTLQLLEEKYASVPSTQIVSLLQGASGLQELASLHSMMRFLTKVNGQVPVSLLFKIALPSLPGQVAVDFATATSTQQCLPHKRRAQCAEKLRERKRKALVEYLLQQESIRAKGIVNADGLFEHFLIDVQMGPQMETTRMKQAISTVQLYVQRCLLGREVEAGVLSGFIRKNKWAWMQGHALWQATRQAFLYPENWLDPTLRDDKTDLFNEYESLVMQKDFSWGTFVEGVKKYVYSLSGIADLDIQAYLRENHEGQSDTYHFFARTRNAPYLFFYRNMAIDRKGTQVLWSPWSKIELDTLTYEADWDGQTLQQSGNYLVPVMRRNRLYLFLPQIMVMTQEAKQKEKETMRKRANGPLADTVPIKKWEIRLAWTELLDGKWTPKQVSQSSLVLDSKLSLPSISNFTFDVLKSSDEELVITVACWRGNGSDSYLLGSFSIREGRVLVTQSTLMEQSQGRTLPTKFQKYTWENKVVTETPTGPQDAMVLTSNLTRTTPLLAVPYQKLPRVLTWTLSYGGDKSREVTGLVVDELNQGRRGMSKFFYSKQETLPESLTSDSLASQSYEANVIHGQTPKLMEAVCGRNGLNDLFAKLEKNAFEDLDKTVVPLDFGKLISDASAAGRHELTTPYGVYNWEIGLHTIMLAMDRFLSTQQFDLALDAARLVFDPTVSAPASATETERATACWKFPPFREVAAKKEKMRDRFTGWPKDDVAFSPSDLGMAVAERRSNPLNAHATARGRTQAYMKWVIMKYVEILLAAGDEYFRRNSLETLPLAIQRYVEAAYVLGPEPPKVPKLGKTKMRTFATFKRDVDLELAFPFMCNLDKRGKDTPKDDDTKGQNLLCIVSTTYFCLPPNPRYQSLRDLVNDRLYKTRNSLDIHGRKIVYSIDEPHIDPGQLMASGLSTSASGLSSVAGDSNGPAPFLRFQYLVGKALEMCNELKATSDQLLSAREKGDGEALALLRAQQDLTKSNLVLGMKQLQQDELNITLDSLRQQREGAVNQLRYYLELSGESLEKIPKEKTAWEDIDYQIEKTTTDHLRMSPYEKMEMICTETATSLNTSAQAMDTYISVLRLIPSITTQAQPMGMGVAVKTDASIIADSLSVQSQAMRLMGMIASDAGARASRVAGLTRQLQERRLQANIKGREIKNLDKQIEAQLKRLDINEQEISMQKKEIEFADTIQKWYEGKFTNEKLYIWLENSIRTMAYDLYTLALDTARMAESAFTFERRSKTMQRFLRPGGYWDAGRDGLLAAQQLSMDLRRMEAFYVQNQAFDFQVTKTVSLRQIDPLALLRLRETGQTEFDVTEMLFDFDFPGHYLRRIKSVSVSIPCLLGPHTSIAGTLTLLEHKYRLTDMASSGADYLKAQGPHFRNDRVPITSVAISSGVQDSGVFELNFKDERLIPFEGAGAISKWRLELPTRVRQFDYHSISDVVLHLRYTSLQGSPLLQQAANEAVDTFRSTIDGLSESQGLFAFFDLKTDLSNQWLAFQRGMRQARESDSSTAVSIDLGDLTSRMPFWVRGKKITVQNAAVAVIRAGLLSEDDAGVADADVSLSLPQVKTAIKWTGNEPMGMCTVLTCRLGKSMDGWKLAVSPGMGDLRTISLVLRYTTSEGQ